MAENTSPAIEFRLRDVSFASLMQRRVHEVLLVASRYDAFTLEEDGRVEEQIFSEYVSLSLSSPPRVTQVETAEEAIDFLSARHFDLVIMMPGVDCSETFMHAREIRSKYPYIYIVVLAPFSRELSLRIENEDLRGVDFVFSWLGNADVLLAIIKLIEDKMNAAYDIGEVGVQGILLVEDSTRFYSSILPHLYKFLVSQSRIFSTEALNDHERMLRMRGRPKVLLARSYEEATDMYNRYGNKILGVISDVRFPREGVMDARAGLEFCEYVRQHDPYLPIIIQSSEKGLEHDVSRLGASFLDKNSPKLPIDLGETIKRNFGFGDFEFTDPYTGEIIARIANLRELQYGLRDIPDDSLLYHSSRNDISRWLYSRALFSIAEVLARLHFDKQGDAPKVRQIITDTIVRYRKMKNRGVVAIFLRDRFDRYSNFARIGEGSLGGKGRGLAFIDQLIIRNPVLDNIEGVSVEVPRTVALCTDVFDEFMENNKLYQIALSGAPDDEILRRFQEAKLPDRVKKDLRSLADLLENPLAIRSSSLLEDSHYQPFAGIYSTYMIPNIKDKDVMLQLMCKAVKAVYASVFYADSKAYMTATSNLIDQEKMAVILQEVVGRQYGTRYYPTFSGVGRSLNYYPLNEEKTEDGVVSLAVGLGKYIVDGGRSLRFSPKHPDKILQTSTIDLALRDTQTSFYALDTETAYQQFEVNDGFNLLDLPIWIADKDGAVRRVVSTYDYNDNMLYDGYYEGGRKVVTFANVLKNKSYPLAKVIDTMLSIGSREMGRPVEIEFTGNLPDSGTKGQIYWLQMRPIVDTKEMLHDDLSRIDDKELFLRSNMALGHGRMNNIRHVLYVKTKHFDHTNNGVIAEEIEKINRTFTEREEPYILIGPGRWGSSDSALGIPVKWPQISGARLIVEVVLENYRIEPSQGTHFFQNLTSFGVGYFTVNAFDGTDVYDEEYLDAQPAAYESEHLRMVCFDKPMSILINGRKRKGSVVKPQ